MNKMDIEKYKKTIQGKIKTLSNYMIDTSVDEDGDEIDLAQGALLSGMAYIQRDRNNDQIKLLSEALDRIMENTFGYCEECGEEIGIRRLNVFPEARHCIKCAEIIEKDKYFFRK